MKVQRLAPTDPAWAGALDGVDHDFYHLPAYVELCAEHEGGEPFALLVRDGESVWLQPLLQRSLPPGLDAPDGAHDVTSPYGYPGPLVRGEPPFARAAAEAMAAYLAEEGCVSCFVRLHPLLNEGVVEHLPGVAQQHGETVVVDLSLDPDEHWRQTRSGHRNEINKAIRKGHVARVTNEDAAFERFVLIYRETMKRVGAAAYYDFDDAYFGAMRDALGPRLALCVVEIDGEIAAGGLFTESCRIVQYHLSGTDERFLRERPNKLMLHHVRRWAADRGNRWFHLGGGVGGGEDNLFRFKAGFSSGRRAFYTWRLQTKPGAYRRLAAQRHADGACLDSHGFFPDYRRPAS